MSRALLLVALTCVGCNQQAPQPVKVEAKQAGPDGGPRKQPAATKPAETWAVQNLERLDKIDKAVGLSDTERGFIEATWQEERAEILRYIVGQKEAGGADWKKIEADIAALRATNDRVIEERLGPERAAVYQKHRPKTAERPDK